MKTIGYIVECRNHGPMMLSDGLLYFGNHVSLFPTLGAARKAVKATITDRLKSMGRDFETEFGRLDIKRVRPTG